MTEWIAVISAGVGALSTIFVERIKHNDHEEVYADHTAELFTRLDKITKERDELKTQVIELQAKVDEQTAQIEQLNEQMVKLTKAVKGVEDEQLD